MQLTTCKAHAETAPASTIAEALITVRDLARFVRHGHHVEYWSGLLAQFGGHARADHCCAAAGYGNYLADAALRTYFRGE